MIRVAAAQIGLGKGSYSRTLVEASRLVERAAEVEAQIVCFPEHWLLEFGEQGHNAGQDLAKAARDHEIYVLTGANYVGVGSDNSPERRIRCSLISPDGGFVGHQDKVHLFRDEKNVASPGEAYEILSTPLAKI